MLQLNFNYIYPMGETTRIYGIRAVMEALQAGREIDRIYIQKGLSGSLYRELEELLNREQIRVSYVPSAKLERMSDGNHQGVVATISPIKYLSLEELVESVKEKNPTLLLLDGVTDVRNLGAIIRTAACAGIQGIILPGRGTAPISGDTVKTSAGAVFKVPIVRVAHLKDAVYYLQAEGISVVAATEKASEEIYDADLKGPIAIIMGSEEKGVHPALLKLADKKLRLPMHGDIASLNVSVACGIFLYEVLRQRR